MNSSALKLILVSTPIGFLGSGSGGGVETTIRSLVKGLLELGHKVTLLAPLGSKLPYGCDEAEIIHFSGMDQPSWQHVEKFAPVVIPFEGVLPKLWEQALHLGKSADAVLNFSYDWLPIWLTPHVDIELFHLISMGSVSQVMREVISQISHSNHFKLAFHSYRQAADYSLIQKPVVLGNGFELNQYDFNSDSEGYLGWAGRIAPEKGLEDAVAVAVALGERLKIWGLVEDPKYAASIDSLAPSGTLDWRGFLPTDLFQKELGVCSALLNTPKWNEAYGNVVVEALACGVPVIAYDRGGPGEIINSGSTGWLVSPDDIDEMAKAISRVKEIDRRACREWVEKSASHDAFTKRVLAWLREGIEKKNSIAGK